MHCDIDRLLCAFLKWGFIFQFENSDYFRMNSSCLLRNTRFVKNTRFRIGAMSGNVIMKFRAYQYQLHTLQDVNFRFKEYCSYPCLRQLHADSGYGHNTAYGQRQSSHKLCWPYPGEFCRFRPASGLLEIALSKSEPDCCGCQLWYSCCMWKD